MKSLMITSELLAKKFDLLHFGNVQNILGFSTPDNQKSETVIWCKTKDIFNRLDKGVVIAPISFEKDKKKNITYLFCEKPPRLIFSQILNHFFSHLLPDNFTNYVDNYKRNPKIIIGDNCFIAKEVQIGEGSVIMHNTSIFSNTKIGKNCHIGPNSSIGTSGLGFEYDGDKIVQFPQLGGVSIGNGVEIGPNSTIRKGALGNTIVENDCKIGSLSNIGHNCFVGAQSILTCQIVLGGSSIIGRKVFMGINSITKNKVKIGNNSTIGMGAVVTKDIPDNVTVVGMPARIITD